MLMHEELTSAIIGAAIEVHKELGPGLLESVYEECLCYELRARGLSYRRQLSVPVTYKGIRLDCGFWVDIVVENKVLIELKAVEELVPLNEAQLLTYLHLSRIPVGLLINFNTVVLKDGIVRRVV